VKASPHIAHRYKPLNTTTMTDKQREQLAKQTELQYEMQKAGLNLVNCGNCGSTLIHETMTRVGDIYDITCPFCQYTSEPCDFPDHFHEGFEQSAEFNNL